MNTGDQVIIKAPGQNPFIAVLDGQLGSHGSQGAVYGLAGRPKLAVKILTGSTAGQAAGKVNAMLAGDRRWTVRGGKIKVTWPVALVEGAAGRFRGYAMFRLDKPEYVPLKLAMPKIGSLVADSNWLWHFNLCEDLARTLVDVGAQRHVVGDLAPPNIFVSASAASVLVDVDGWQVHSGGTNGYFPCAFSRPDYTAPEHLDANGHRRPESDWWALAVLIGEVLFLGSHPFGGVLKHGHQVGAEEDENVRHRQCWLLGGQVDVPAGTLPRDLLPARLMRLFERCFETGYDHPARRPSPETWAGELDMAWRELAVCELNHRHFYPRERRTCPWCEHRASGMPDFFPGAGVPSGQAPPAGSRPGRARSDRPTARPDAMPDLPPMEKIFQPTTPATPATPKNPVGASRGSRPATPPYVPPAPKPSAPGSRSGGAIGVFVAVFLLVVIIAYVLNHA